MNKTLTIILVVIAGIMTGCAHIQYRVYVYNGTPSKITGAKVTLSNGESLAFGTLDSKIDAGIWPVVGPLGQESVVEWMDVSKEKKTAKASILCKPGDDSVIFLVNTNDTVTVETGRKLYGHKKSVK